MKVWDDGGDGLQRRTWGLQKQGPPLGPGGSLGYSRKLLSQPASDPLTPRFSLRLKNSLKKIAVGGEPRTRGQDSRDKDLSGGGMNGLIKVYLERRDALIRYFTLRLGSAAQAEDLAQDIYLKIAGFSEEDIAAVNNPAAFLYRLGTNLMLDRIKQVRRSVARDDDWRRSQAVDVGGEDAADIPAADEALAAKQKLEIIVQALNDLSPPCRRAFRLHKFEGLSHAETAQAMGISKSGVEKHISAALKHLIARLE